MNRDVILFSIILLVGCLGQVGTDIYTPSLPAIAHTFHMSISLSQWSLVSYMIGAAIAMLFYGPISEALGRKSPLLFGLVIMLIGTCVCLFARSIEMLIVGRFIQGCGAAAGMTLWRSIFRDRFKGEELAKYGSYLGIFVMLIIPVAPVIGGYLQHYIGWRGSFMFLLVYILIAITVVAFLFRETSQHHATDHFKISFIFNSFKKLLVSRTFIGNTLCVFLCYGAFFSWFTAGPVLLIHIVGLSPVQFGWITLFVGVASSGLGAFINGKLVTRLGIPFMLRSGWSIMIMSGVAMLVCKFIFGINVWDIVIPVIFFCFGIAFIWPNAFASAFESFGDIAGYASSLYGFMQIAGGAAVGGLVAHLPTKNQLPLAIIFIVMAALAWFVYETIAKPSKALS